MRFAGGYIRHWWKEAGRLPPAMQPLFCLQHKFTDPFITFEERALPPILWSTSKKNPNPYAAAASKIMTSKEASALVESMHGELIRILFYGEPDEIRKSHSVWQTSYGRRSTPMEALATIIRPSLILQSFTHTWTTSSTSSTMSVTVERKDLHATRVPLPSRQVSSHRIRPYACNDSRSTISFRQTVRNSMSHALIRPSPTGASPPLSLYIG